MDSFVKSVYPAVIHWHGSYAQGIASGPITITRARSLRAHLPASLETLPTVYPTIWAQSGFCSWRVSSLASVSLFASQQAQLRSVDKCATNKKPSCQDLK